MNCKIEILVVMLVGCLLTACTNKPVDENRQQASEYIVNSEKNVQKAYWKNPKTLILEINSQNKHETTLALIFYCDHLQALYGLENQNITINAISTHNNQKLASEKCS
ncbi:hypothetical protein [Moraxella equi]|uniref:Uncharacterized protein n=1 Tax=Moraxella equi TaxID=60442 RepID=A0A378QRG9_9GAMM|nr:hypothetical protein [Moraxella equi]OPH38324.1 hypothetical protein B5J93_06475 [Moraxella equi]STZ03477.1 Uncharacterised protein [Moraxella equi]